MSALVATLALGFQYWNDPRIHMFGNVGFRGGIHALLAPLSTRIIDHAAYDGVDLRAEILRDYVPPGHRVVDLCCGVGASTLDVGVDASEQMLGVARWTQGGKTFRVGNAETWGEPDSYEMSTCMFAFHEMPRDARKRVLANMLRIAPTALVVDIAPDYSPSPAMLWGEPYLLEYKEHMDEDVVAAAETTSRRVLVPGHAVLWTLVR